MLHSVFPYFGNISANLLKALQDLTSFPLLWAQRWVTLSSKTLNWTWNKYKLKEIVSEQYSSYLWKPVRSIIQEKSWNASFQMLSDEPFSGTKQGRSWRCSATESTWLRDSLKHKQADRYIGLRLLPHLLSDTTGHFDSLQKVRITPVTLLGCPCCKAYR